MTFTDLNLTVAGYCYRVRVQNPDTSAYSFSNYAPANVVAPAPGITVSPDYSVDVISTASLAVPGTGAQTITLKSAWTPRTATTRCTTSWNRTRSRTRLPRC